MIVHGFVPLSLVDRRENRRRLSESTAEEFREKGYERGWKLFPVFLIWHFC